jgi:hypothetical protein
LSVSLETYTPIPDLIRAQTAAHAEKSGLGQDARRVHYGALDALRDRIAGAVQRDGVVAGESNAICAATSVE